MPHPNLLSLRALSLWGAALLTGCADYELNGIRDPNAADATILVTPESLVFDELEPGQTAVLGLEIQSIGNAALYVEGAPLITGSSFTLVSDPGNVSLEPGEILELEVAFSPVDIENTGTLFITSSDDQTPVSRVLLEGIGLFPRLTISPDPLDAGEEPVGCESEETLWLESSGTATLEIDTLAVTGTGFRLGEVDLPLVLAPGEVAEVPVYFGPLDLVEHTGVFYAATNEPVPQVTSDLAGMGGAVFTVATDELDFEAAMVGCETEDVVPLQYLGCEGLTVVDISVGEGPFEITELPDLPLTLEGGEEIGIPMRFTPEAEGEYADVLTVELSDGSLIDVELLGVGEPPGVDFEDDVIVFDDTLLGCEDGKDTFMFNPFDCPVTVTGYGLGSNVFALAEVPGTPQTLEPGEKVRLELLYLPDDYAQHRNELTVVVEGSSERSRLSLRGESLLSDEAEDTFAFDGEFDAVDVMFWIDQSGSMDEEQDALEAQAEAYVGALEYAGVDWQLGVAAGSNGCFSTGIITPDTPDPTAAFVSGIGASANSNSEAGLTVAASALVASCNKGFVRDEAVTRVVLVSDEPEQSWDSWSNLTARIQAAGNDVVISSIVGDYPHGCPGAEAGTGYYEATVATGGLFLSICEDDWSAHAGQLAALTDGILDDTYSLSAEPIESTIEVTVDGGSFSSWTYDAGLNAIIIDDISSFDNGSLIAVTYIIATACD